MSHKLIWAGLVALTLAVPFVLPKTAEAHSPVRHHHRAVYDVLFRHRHHWHNYHTYSNRWEAEHAARQLRCEGFHVLVERR